MDIQILRGCKINTFVWKKTELQVIVFNIKKMCFAFRSPVNICFELKFEKKNDIFILLSKVIDWLLCLKCTCFIK